MAQLESQKLKLLVVDDESDNLDLLYRTFRQDFNVFRADSAPNALAVLEQEGEMAIIISDQRMPKMKGTELLSRTVKQFPDTIRIVLTGYTDVEDLVDAINTGKVFKYITKPWNPTDLKNIVRQASETYCAIKRRTNELHRALRRESVFNAMITAIRESLDYRQILETTVETLGHTLAADAAVLIPVDSFNADAEQPYQFSVEQFIYQASSLPKLASKSNPSNAKGLDSERSPDVNSPRVDLAEQGCVDSKAALMLSGITSGITSANIEPHLRELLHPTLLSDALKNRHIQNQLLELNHHCYAQLVVPLVYQQESLAILALFKADTTTTWTDEEQRLVSDVAEQAALAISQARLYQQIQEQTQQMRDELTVAQRIQTHLLRQSIPQIEGIKIQACCAPAREVGGDFFEIYDHPNGDVWLAVGDVSGKGVPAALFMSSTLSVLRRELSQETPPAPDEVLRNLNSNLLDGLVGSNCFITLALASYTPATRQLVYANAGHILPMILPRSPSSLTHQTSQVLSNPEIEPQYLKVRGVPLGILQTWTATSETLQLSSGDTFLLASDGITEARVSPEWLQTLSSKATGRATQAATQTESDGTKADGTNSRGEAFVSPAISPSDRPEGYRDYQMLRQQGLWHLLRQHQAAPSLEAVLAKIQAHSLGQEDDQTILSMEIL
ncbi:MAG: SpoIIE family protein phosphatase [Elainellaceae cyanobacterium]